LTVWLYRLAPGVLDALKIVRPETVIRWHRTGFRAYWRWKSRPRGGRPKTPLELRQLIREMSPLQLFLAVLFAVCICFQVLGRNYDAAVVSAGFIGFGLGATPTAMANMTAVTQRHGPSHVAFLVVPLVGAFFIDIANAFVIRLFLAAL
jgi:Sodium/glutamate symporter